jgi:hypothetical protein
VTLNPPNAVAAPGKRYARSPYKNGRPARERRRPGNREVESRCKITIPIPRASSTEASQPRTCAIRSEPN